MDGIFATTALILILTQFYGNQKNKIEREITICLFD